MTISARNSIDINTVLQAFNLFVAGLIVYGMPYAANNPYIDQETMQLGLLLCLQTHVALFFERRRRDPFVILFAFTMIFYFSLRLFTLALYPYSVVFERYSYGPADSNFALIFMLVANLFLYAGFFSVKFKRNAAVDASGWRARSPTRVSVLMLVSIVYSYMSAIYWTADDQPRIASVLGLFISPPVIFLMALAYFVLFRRSLSRSARYSIAGLIALELVAHTLSGSRSTITTLVQNIMLVMLAISSCIKIKRGWFIVGSLLAPVLLVLLIGAFLLSTFNREHKDPGEASLSISQAIQLAGEATKELGAETELDIILPPIFDRAGFFDYSAEIIAHRDQYQEIFNLPEYGKSIVDNLLTPGFDVYDQPKLGNALEFIYEDLGTPSKEMVPESYQSDQFGIHGELYAVFGYASLPLFFLLAFFLKGLYVRLRSPSPFALAMERIVVLAAFVKIVNSFGMDWTLIEMVPVVAAVFVYTFFFRTSPIMRRTSMPSPLDHPSAPLGIGARQ
ncbi:MAG: hypothetical protein ACLP2F_11585 [Steroidobacteraceae bacterium]